MVSWGLLPFCQMGLLAGVAIKAINSSTKTFFGMWKERNWHIQKRVLLLEKKRDESKQE